MKFRTQINILAVTILLAGCTPVGQQNGQPDAGPAPAAIGPGTLNVADAAIAGGDPDMALSVTQSVLATDPHNADALVHEGDAYYALSRCNSAEAAYNLALTNDPKSTAAETGLGRCLLKTDPPAAEAALLLAVQDDPGNAAAYNDLGIARDLQGNFAGAVQPYQQALQADPALTAAEVNLGLSLALSGNGAAALQYLGPLATGPGATPKIREDYAAALVASGRPAEARQVLAVDLPPDEVNAAMDGFSAVIAGAQAPLTPPAAAAAPPTAPTVQTASIAATPLPGSPPPPTPPAVTAPPPAPAMPYTPDNSTAAYTGPVPIPGVIAAPSKPDPGTPPVATPAVATAPGPLDAAKSFNTAVAHSGPVTPPAPPVDAPAASSSGGTYKVQLAALNSQSDAEREWSKIAGAMPALFGGKQPDIETATVNGHTYYRLRTGSFDTKADAAKFCGEVSASGSTCTLANF
jgi:Flp pilus assembly protein TadD